MSHAPHVSLEALSKFASPLAIGRIRAPCRGSRMYSVTDPRRNKLHYPLVGHNMVRGNHDKYTYTKGSLSHWGEGLAVNKYHQHYAHAKCPTDYGKGGREFEYLTVKRGKMTRLPIPKVQYIDAKTKPTWVFKSWHGGLGNIEVWQREVQYPEHVPEHIEAKRPLTTLAPQTFHKTIHLAHMEKITITLSPLMFGFGKTTQAAVLMLYQRLISARSPFPKDKVSMFYSIDLITPRITVTWVDGSVYEPPVMEGCTAQDLTQMIMEQSWLAADRISASGKPLQPLAIDDYKWFQRAIEKKKKKAATKS